MMMWMMHDADDGDDDRDGDVDSGGASGGDMVLRILYTHADPVRFS